MPGLTGVSNQAPRIVSGSLNTEDMPAVGVPLASPSGSIVSAYGGLLGGKLFLSSDDARKLSNTTVGTLYGGIYQMVRTASSATGIARGRLGFWDIGAGNDNKFLVHQDETQNGGNPVFAGVFLNSITPGNYGWIQIEGKASMLARATVTAATRYVFWANAGAGADNAKVDTLAAAVTWNAALLWNFLGISEAVGTNGSMLTVDMRPLVFRQ